MKIEVLEWGSFKTSLKILKGRSSKGAYIRRMIASMEQDSGLVPESEESSGADAKKVEAKKQAETPSTEKPTDKDDYQFVTW